MKINIKVKTNSGKQEVEKMGEDEYLVFVKAVPENNKANLEVEKVLRKYFKKDVKILRGKTSKRKVAEVEE
ncbi:MAG: DUF167 family protein [Candidatus Pacearchaeota archaeon]|jgi:uncharacterized protein (TIGR00251 family)